MPHNCYDRSYFEAYYKACIGRLINKLLLF